MTRIQLTLGLVVSMTLTICAQPPGFVYDRSVAGIDFVSTGDGLHDIFVRIAIRSNDSSAVDMSFKISTQVGAQPVQQHVVIKTTAATGDCANETYATCSQSTCTMTDNGVTYSGECKKDSCDSEQTASLECVCEYVITRHIGKKRLHSGEKYRATVSVLPGAVPDACLDNNEKVVWFGARADHPSCGIGPFRRKAPIGGQPAGGACGLNQVGLHRQGAGPYEFWGAGGSIGIAAHSTMPGMPATLLLGTPSTGWLDIPDLGSVDLDLSLPMFAIYDGLGIFGPPQGIAGPLIQIPYPLPAGTTTNVASLQGISLDPGSPSGLCLTERNDIAVQDTTSLGVPALAPFSSGQAYPWPRDVICPNNGPVSSAVGANDGTLHSAMGKGFDATQAGATTATVNGVFVDVVVVRPNEILFHLNPGHEAGIGGPLEISSTGGTALVAPDQMENWVIATPWQVWNEQPGVLPGAHSGVLNPDGGLQAVIGRKQGQGAVDFWKLHYLSLGTQVKCFLGQVDALTGQIKTFCSLYPAVPPSLCFPTTSEPRTQQPSTPGNQDVTLRLSLASSPGMALQQQDDGGPGTCSFAGMSHPGGPATDPVLDPDGPFIINTQADHYLVCDQWTIPGATYPYFYILVISW